MFEHQLLPSGEDHMHMPFQECKCRPTIRVHNGKTWLIHRAFDQRERWMAVEIMLGYRCKRHLLPIVLGSGSVFTNPCLHISEPEKYYEYDHK